MKKQDKLSQHKVNLVFSVLIGILFAYSIFATYFVIEAYNGLESTTQDLSSQIFNLWTKGTPEQ